MKRKDDLIKNIAFAMNSSSDEITVVSKCGDGYTNENFIFEYNCKKYVYRKSSSSANNLSINRNAEYQAAIEIKKAVKTPDIIFFDFNSGDMITEHVDGRVLENNELLDEMTLVKIISCLKSIHRQKTGYIFDPYKDISSRIDYASNKGINDFDYKKLTGHMDKIKEKAPAGGNSDFTGLCHNDFFTTNFLMKDDDIIVFDFEFSAMGDVFFDLACLAMVMPENHHKKILETYFGRADEFLENRLTDVLYIARLWNATWALVQYADGCTNYDYRKAIEYHFDLLHGQGLETL